MPDRQILDFLMEYFVAEVNWTDQLVHIPWLLGKYQQWWLIEKVTLVLEVDLAVLILRICSYASQYLPSQGYTLNRIDGALLADIRNMCDETAGSLISISRALDKRGSLIQVQSMAFYGLKCQMEGRRNAFWESLDRAIKVAQAIGLHSEAVRVRQGLDEIEKEMERRTFCNLYIWDSSLSRQLDRTALLSGRLDPGNWPQIYFESDNDSSELAAVVPDPFTERLLQVRLADFWRFVRPAPRSEFDMVVAEEIYDQFCRDYMAKLPCTFSLDPDKTWDKRLPKLQLQRQLLHIAIYESLCWHFRPVLLHHDKSMPSYKRVLLDAHKRALAVAALHTLQGVSQLHAMLSGSHRRFAGLIFSTFDAAVLLVYLCTDPQFPPPCLGHKTCTICPKIDPLRPGMITLSRQECIQAVQSALNWLRMLGEEISAADIGANTLTQLLSSVCKTDTPTTTAVATNGTEMKDVLSNQDIVATTVQSDMPNWHSLNPLDLQLLENFLPMDTSSSLGDMTSWPSLDSSMFSP
ncbi:hypothetical protein BGW36DRAFT_106709 [Talaromyces proteolyticus]|uniref:Xylanolytic transcriptional activator regulatory domain-containing protein n=1 Tax=Talaromyces proteolyticus TaxID=1131652 RepID=A0AAD4Q3J9_9EURO|nr:uncharacterized protein BGW36DRAFT_106709 [Talaromyces proteolyticus]KAH8701856.1 hypothetical protein BGW36DRAFT_106709 [Talaromyces proteolyticus]